MNVYRGPGTTYAVVGKATEGQVVTIADKNPAGDLVSIGHRRMDCGFFGDAERCACGGDAHCNGDTYRTRYNGYIRNDSVAQTYIKDLGIALELFSSGTSAVADRFRSASANPSVMLTGRWKLAVIEGLAKVQVSSNSIRSLEPTACFSDVHNDLLSMADHSDNSVALIAEGMDNMDFEQMGEGANGITLASEFPASAQVKIEALVSAAATLTPVPATPTKTPAPRPTATKTPVPTATRQG